MLKSNCDISLKKRAIACFLSSLCLTVSGCGSLVPVPDSTVIIPEDNIALSHGISSKNDEIGDQINKLKSTEKSGEEILIPNILEFDNDLRSISALYRLNDDLERQLDSAEKAGLVNEAIQEP